MPTPLRDVSGVCAFGVSWERRARRHRERFAHRTSPDAWASSHSKTARPAMWIPPGKPAAWERFCPMRIGACWAAKARMRPGAWVLSARTGTA